MADVVFYGFMGVGLLMFFVFVYSTTHYSRSDSAEVKLSVDVESIRQQRELLAKKQTKNRKAKTASSTSGTVIQTSSDVTVHSHTNIGNLIAESVAIDLLNDDSSSTSSSSSSSHSSYSGSTSSCSSRSSCSSYSSCSSGSSCGGSSSCSSS